MMEVPVGIEPTSTVLQTAASPFGLGTRGEGVGFGVLGFGEEFLHHALSPIPKMERATGFEPVPRVWKTLMLGHSHHTRRTEKELVRTEGFEPSEPAPSTPCVCRSATSVKCRDQVSGIRNQVKTAPPRPFIFKNHSPSPIPHTLFSGVGGGSRTRRGTDFKSGASAISPLRRKLCHFFQFLSTQHSALSTWNWSRERESNPQSHGGTGSEPVVSANSTIPGKLQ